MHLVFKKTTCLAVCIWLTAGPAPAQSPLYPTRLTGGYSENFLGIDHTTPRLRWAK